MSWLRRDRRKSQPRLRLGPDQLLDGAIDALASVVRILGRNPIFDDPDEREAFRRRCEFWARHVLTGVPDEEALDSFAGASAQARQWTRLTYFLQKQRKREQEIVGARFDQFKLVISNFIDGLRSIGREDAVGDVQIELTLEALEEAVKKDSVAAMRALVPVAVADVRRSIERRREKVGGLMKEMGERLVALRADLVHVRRQLEIDKLTQLYNRGAFDETIGRFLRLSTLSGQPALLLMLDLDHFKFINDKYGHPAGDDVLRQVANTIVRTFPRRSDFVARYGGEEFAVLLHDASLDDGPTLANRLLENVRQLRVVHGDATLSVTCSVGYAQPEPGETPGALVERADKALYKAKDAGRDRAVAG